MIGKKVTKALNDQINEEFFSAFLYLSMASQAELLGLKGLANWMYVQHQEEHSHAMSMTRYLLDQGVHVQLGAMKAPKTKWKSALEIMEDTAAHEQHITSCINGIMSIAIEEKDYATINFLQWFVNEQVQEEAVANELVTKLKMADNKGALLFVDAELATRTFTTTLTVKATPVQLA